MNNRVASSPSVNPAGGSPSQPSGVVCMKPPTNRLDKRVGNRVRMTREFRNVSSAAAATCLGISPQQLDRYESGVLRFSAHDLLQLSRLLRVRPSFFLEDRNKKISSWENYITSTHNVISIDRFRRGKNVPTEPLSPDFTKLDT
jgi:transcriptional regulator with XRE-family HTH domain